ncbi:MAG: TIGR03084 family metal-binding protein, partial [Acidimicrobiales bacterium]
LTGPSGEQWQWGPGDDAAEAVAGPALDFCLVVTQRRRVADTALVMTGSGAAEWMEIAQAFAGPPGPGR